MHTSSTQEEVSNLCPNDSFSLTETPAVQLPPLLRLIPEAHSLIHVSYTILHGHLICRWREAYADREANNSSCASKLSSCCSPRLPSAVILTVKSLDGTRGAGVYYRRAKRGGAAATWVEGQGLRQDYANGKAIERSDDDSQEEEEGGRRKDEKRRRG